MSGLIAAHATVPAWLGLLGVVSFLALIGGAVGSLYDAVSARRPARFSSWEAFGRLAGIAVGIGAFPILLVLISK